jgi:transposase
MEQMELCNTYLEELIEDASKLPSFAILLSIPGIGRNIAARIIAEIGDVTRFRNARGIAAYAGLNPKINQSGEKDGTHLAISKKGNRHLRCLLYLAVTCSYRLKKGDSIYQFNQKKRQQAASPLKPKAANIAAADKLLAVIYSLMKNGSTFRS